MTSIEMRNLIMEALDEKNKDKAPFAETFEQHNYEGDITRLKKSACPRQKNINFIKAL